WPARRDEQRIDARPARIGGGQLVNQADVAERRREVAAGRGTPELRERDDVRRPPRDLSRDGFDAYPATGTDVPGDDTHAAADGFEVRYIASASCWGSGSGSSFSTRRSPMP